MCHHWPVKKAIVDLPIRLKGNSNLRYGNNFIESDGAPEQGSWHLLADVTSWGLNTFATQATKNRHP